MELVQQIAVSFLEVCAGISCVCVAGGWVIKVIRGMMKPSKTQNDRLAELEKKNTEYSEKLSRDLERIEKIEHGNRVTQRALLALLEHGIDGNDIDAMKKAKAELQEYLIEG